MGLGLGFERCGLGCGIEGFDGEDGAFGRKPNPRIGGRGRSWELGFCESGLVYYWFMIEPSWFFIGSILNRVGFSI